MEQSRRSNEGPILKVEGITVQFGGLTALKNVSTSLRAGEIRGIIGPNGAGKTTFFNAITGFVPLQSGTVTFAGGSITGRKSYDIAELGVVRTFQRRGTIATLTALENVLTGCHRLMQEVGLGSICFRGRHFREAEREAIRTAEGMLKAVGIPDVSQQTASALSFGQQTLVEIARALVSRPKVLLLDEPAAGLSSLERDHLKTLLKSLPVTHGVSLIITDHIMDFLMDICESLTVLNFGEKLEEGTPAYIRSHPGVLEAYFGRA
jgi:branched-chain amino acid transport system ATP-binding protein